MSATAYIVLIIKPRRDEAAIVVGAGIFSESSPTLGSKVSVVLDHFDADSYEKAHVLAERALRSESYGWIGPIHEGHTRGPYRMDARALDL